MWRIDKTPRRRDRAQREKWIPEMRKIKFHWIILWKVGESLNSFDWNLFKEFCLLLNNCLASPELPWTLMSSFMLISQVFFLRNFGWNQKQVQLVFLIRSHYKSLHLNPFRFMSLPVVKFAYKFFSLDKSF